MPAPRSKSLSRGKRNPSREDFRTRRAISPHLVAKVLGGKINGRTQLRSTRVQLRGSRSHELLRPNVKWTSPKSIDKSVRDLAMRVAESIPSRVEADHLIQHRNAFVVTVLPRAVGKRADYSIIGPNSDNFAKYAARGIYEVPDPKSPRGYQELQCVASIAFYNGAKIIYATYFMKP